MLLSFVLQHSCVQEQMTVPYVLYKTKCTYLGLGRYSLEYLVESIIVYL